MKPTTIPDHFITEDGKVFRSSGEKLIEVPINQDRFLTFNYYIGKEVFSKSLHREVATAYVPNPHKFPYVGFKDNNSNNCKAPNLKWVKQVSVMLDLDISFIPDPPEEERFYVLNERHSLYISNHGRIRLKGKIKPTKPRSNGTVAVFIKQVGSIYVHRVMARKFVPNPNGHSKIGFLDGSKLNIFPSNLVWIPSNGMDRTKKKSKPSTKIDSFLSMKL